jgi:hypothetical protein
LVVNASTAMITIDRFVQKVFTWDTSWPHILHLHDCSQLELLLKYDSQHIVAVHCVITSPASIGNGIFLQFSKKLKAWVHKNNQWEQHIDPTSLTFVKNIRFIFTNLDLSRVNTINRALSEHKWYWT